jgi:flagellar hook-length control protein FliK
MGRPAQQQLTAQELQMLGKEAVLNEKAQQLPSAAAGLADNSSADVTAQLSRNSQQNLTSFSNDKQLEASGLAEQTIEADELSDSELRRLLAGNAGKADDAVKATAAGSIKSLVAEQSRDTRQLPLADESSKVNQATSELVDSDASPQNLTFEQAEQLASQRLTPENSQNNMTASPANKAQPQASRVTSVAASVSSVLGSEVNSSLQQAPVVEVNQLEKVQQNAVVNEVISIQRKDFPEQVKEQVNVMMNLRLKQIDIRLDPPELGSMQIKLNMQGEQANVSIVVQNPQARDAIEQNMVRLREMLAEQGVDLGDTNIEQQNQEQQLGRGGHQGSEKANNGDDESHPGEELAINLSNSSATGIDYYA